ncbi:MAG TPA: VOC family protein [Candidatus Binatia bacterium]|nr:VOC family protein [Candidatus Binatia bacterium]
MPQTIFPMIAYANAAAAMDWLVRAFGFRETTRMTAPDGTVIHGELELSDAKVMLATPTPEYQGPFRHAETCEAARHWSAVPYIIDGVLVYVDDVNAHYARAKAEGATILSDLEESQAGRRYRAADLEGHRWMFAQKQ